MRAGFTVAPLSFHSRGACPGHRERTNLDSPHDGKQSPRTVLVAATAVLAIGVSIAAPVAPLTHARAPTAAPAQPSHPFAAFTNEAAQRFSVPKAWIRAVMQRESRGDVSAVSPKGAVGLMGVMPGTYAELRLRYHLGTDPFAPRDNILAGAAYLREMHDRFGSSGFLAAYNAGPRRYEEYLKGIRPLPDETLDYVAALAPLMGVPGLPRQPGNVPPTSRTAVSRTRNITGMQSSSSNILRFDDRHGSKSTTLFAPVRTAFESASPDAHASDMTALEPTQNRASSTAPSAVERPLVGASKSSRASFSASGNALFVGRPARLDN